MSIWHQLVRITAESVSLNSCCSHSNFNYSALFLGEGEVVDCLLVCFGVSALSLLKPTV